MRCFSDLLSANIAGCPSIVGYEANAIIFKRSDVVNRIYTDNVVEFNLVGLPLPVYVPGDLPFKPSVEGSMNANGLQKFNKKLTFFIVENSPLSQQQVMELENEAYVCLLRTAEGRIEVYGMEAGLRFQSSSQELSSVETHGGISVEMAENNCNYSMVFTTYDVPFTVLTHEWISGITIGDGTSTPLEASIKTLYTTKTSYIKYPDNTTVSSTAGVVNKEWDGEAGSVIIIIPKDTGTLYLSDGTNASKFIGAFDIKESVNTLLIQYCPYITSVSTQKSTDVRIDNSVSVETLIAPLATNILAASSGLTDAGVKLILDNAYSLYLDGVIDGQIDLSGTTAIDGSNVSTVHAPADYNSMISAMELAGWTITIVTI